jgi:hypothetical protein
MIVELVGFIMAFAYKGQLTSVYKTTLSTVFDKALEKNDTTVLGAFHQLETAMKCCAVHNISDYNNHTSAASDWCQKNPTSPGCSDAIIDFLNKHLPIIGGSLGGVVLLELFGVIGAVLLARAVRRSDD